MKVEQTQYFKEDVEHFTKLAKEWMYTTNKEKIRASILKLDGLRNSSYTDKVIAKCNQKLHMKFYERPHLDGYVIEVLQYGKTSVGYIGAVTQTGVQLVTTKAEASRFADRNIAYNLTVEIRNKRLIADNLAFQITSAS